MLIKVLIGARDKDRCGMYNRAKKIQKKGEEMPLFAVFYSGIPTPTKG